MSIKAPTRPAAAPDALFAYKVSGMDCPTCASKVKNALGRFDSITDVRVNFANQILTFRARAEGADTEAVEAVRKLGYGVEPLNGPAVGAAGEERFRVTGMDCASCAVS